MAVSKQSRREHVTILKFLQHENRYPNVAKIKATGQRCKMVYRYIYFSHQWLQKFEKIIVFNNLGDIKIKTDYTLV